MINLTDLSERLSSRPLTQFLKSKACERAQVTLSELGVPENQILKKQNAYRGVPSVVYAHKLVAIEYIRWADYTVFAKKMVRL